MGRHSKKSRVKVVTRNAALVAGATGTAVTVAGFPAHAESPNWTPIIACESGGDPTAQNTHSTASGLLQFLDSSWLAYGGGQYASRAKFATASQQLAVGNVAFARSGYTPWEASRSCWGSKIALRSPVTRSTPAPRLSVPVAVPSAGAHEPGPGKYHVVKSGDTLYRIAAQSTGSGTNWPHIYELNKSVVGDNPNLIYPGQELAI